MKQIGNDSKKEKKKFKTGIITNIMLVMLVIKIMIVLNILLIFTWSL